MPHCTNLVSRAAGHSAKGRLGIAGGLLEVRVAGGSVVGRHIDGYGVDW